MADAANPGIDGLNSLPRCSAQHSDGFHYKYRMMHFDRYDRIGRSSIGWMWPKTIRLFLGWEMRSLPFVHLRVMSA